ncbi:Dynamin-like protein ARC5 [Tetrabaena socialis]|uniref:Dynamin-like protein ARC5 n=1 Tax=Tetrabaena socialis TaxID=47790 RepID=A0A2J8A9K6_9CHLO|nr:Dynamin-like protein ARC5 [Tetrabaena socialis]|eukprot:PNH09185.1 Dynamin-like protein ARC5 [Tetrabaena socialis]
MAPYDDGADDVADRNSKLLLRGHERLYDAYNELHALAQSFNKPFDAPAILVVGHQTDGKSALVEALMGFQFNSVGGGTKTRRPIAIHMKYNGACTTPACYLKLEDGVSEQEMTLGELQAYIDADNAALEREQRFASREVVVRMEYKHCPNLCIIDTPGLITPAPGKKNCALQACAAQVEEIVRNKAQVPEYVILCLEDCSDWSNATTRRLVMQVDPNLARTVLVSTKFDTRLPQFARAADCEMFLRPATLEGCTMLGDAPFFTSVPSGRVGSAADCVFASDDAFRERLADREAADVAELEAKLNRKLSRAERDHIGVGALRRFLEQLLQDKGRAFVDSFLSRLQQLLRGTIAAPVDKWGETLSEEHSRGGSFTPGHSRSLPAPEPVPNAAMRLYGGAQFHRAMSEFRNLTGISEDIVRALVFQMFEGIRDHLVQAAELKFNCFFLMPLVDSFPARLRKEIERAYEEGLDDVFDAASVRSALEGRAAELGEELHRVGRLQRQFHAIHSTLVHGPSLASGPTSRAINTDLDASIMLASVVLASPLPHSGGGAAEGGRQIGGRLAAAAAAAGAARTPDMTSRAAPMSGALAAAPRRATPSAAGAAAVAASAAGGGSQSLSQHARALSQQQQGPPYAGAPQVLERDRGERDAKDKALHGGLSVADKVAAAQQQAAGQAVQGR